MDYQTYIKQIFPNHKVQKISINAGFSCPNRDGTIGIGGCIYCRNDSFTPAYCLRGDNISTQVEKGKIFFRRKYKEMKFLAYFQSYTNTYSRDTSQIIQLYEEAISCEGIVGLVIGTRPDTLPRSLMDYLENLNKEIPVFIEIGGESSFDKTLRIINRGHTWRDVTNATEMCASRGLHTGLHLIAGLPGESREMMLCNVRQACKLPIETLKLHHLQILKNTVLYSKWLSGEISLEPFTLEDYLSLCVEICHIVPPSIVIERFLAQSPANMVVAPKWGLKNYQFMHLLNNRLNCSKD